MVSIFPVLILGKQQVFIVLKHFTITQWIIWSHFKKCALGHYPNAQWFILLLTMWAQLRDLYNKVIISGRLNCYLDILTNQWQFFFKSQYNTLHIPQASVWTTFSSFLNWKLIPDVRFEHMMNIFLFDDATSHHIKRGALEVTRLMKNSFEWVYWMTIFKKINVLFTDHLYFGKYSFRLNTF